MRPPYARLQVCLLTNFCRNGSKLFYRDKAERWRAYLFIFSLLLNPKLTLACTASVLHRLEAAERVWCSLIEGHPTPAMDYRKPLLIYWFMSHIIKCVLSPLSLTLYKY